MMRIMERALLDQFAEQVAERNRMRAEAQLPFVDVRENLIFLIHEEMVRQFDQLIGKHGAFVGRIRGMIRDDVAERVSTSMAQKYLISTIMSKIVRTEITEHYGINGPCMSEATRIAEDYLRSK